MKTLRTTLAAFAVFTVAACSSSTAGTATNSPASTSSTASSTSATSTSETSSSATAITSTSSESESSSGSSEVDPVAAELVAGLAAAYTQVSSLHGTLHIVADTKAGGNQDAEFDETLTDGKVDGLKMDYTAASQTFNIVFTGNKIYMGGAVAASLGGGKPWVELSENTKNAQLKSIYTQFIGTVDQSGPTTYVDFLKLAKGTTKEGTETINGVETQKYALTLDLTNLDTSGVSDSTKTSLGNAAKLGLTEVPCIFWIDANGLMQQVEQDLAVAGSEVKTTIIFSNYNEPVEIAAPDPSETSVP